MARKKFTTRTRKAEVRAKVALLDRRGYTQQAIADQLGVTQPMVTYYLKQVRKQYVEEMALNGREAIAERLAQLRDIRVEAWQAWETSKNGTEKTAEEEQLRSEFDQFGRGPKPSRGEVMKLVKRLKSVEKSGPRSEYLSIVKDCIVAEARLCGLWDGDLNITMFNAQQNNGVVVDWTAMKKDENGRSGLRCELEDEMTAPLPPEGEEQMEPLRMIGAPKPNGDGHATD